MIAEVSSLIEYHRLSKRLRELGFIEDQSPDAPYAAGNQARVPIILQRMKALAATSP